MKGNNGRGLRLEQCIACIISFYAHSSYFLKPHACITSEDIKAILWLFPNQPGILKQKSKFKLVSEKFHLKEVLEKGPSMHISLYHMTCFFPSVHALKPMPFLSNHWNLTQIMDTIMISIIFIYRGYFMIFCTYKNLEIF